MQYCLHDLWRYHRHERTRKTHHTHPPQKKTQDIATESYRTKRVFEKDVPHAATWKRVGVALAENMANTAARHNL